MTAEQVNQPTLYLVDDDADVRTTLRALLEHAGRTVQTFADGEAFLQACGPQECGCLLLDLELPGASGLEVLQQLMRENWTLPVIMISGMADIATAVEAVSQGAETFLEKPFDQKRVLESVERAFVESARRQRGHAERDELTRRFDSLTPREREVFDAVVSGQSTRQIAHLSGVSHRTVEVQRSRILKKTGAASAVDLVRLAFRLGIVRDSAPDSM